MGPRGSASARGFAAVGSLWGRGCHAQPKARRAPRRFPTPTPLPPAPARAVACWRPMEGPGIAPVLTPPSPAPERERSCASHALGRGSWAPSRSRGPWQGLARLWGWRQCRGSLRVVPWVRPAAPGFQAGTGPRSPSRGLLGFAPRAGLSSLGEPSEAAAAAKAEQLLITHVQQSEKNVIP